MEAAAGVIYRCDGKVKAGCPTVVTYADDFVALCHSQEQAETVQARLEPWLKERGLSINPGKTRITRVEDGFDFLSFTIRRHHQKGGAKLLTTPSRSAIQRIRRRNAEELRALRGAKPIEVINIMNPIIRGQANYFRSGTSSKAFKTLDNHLAHALTKWARSRHPGKSRWWVSSRYFGSFHPTRTDRWVFGDRETGAYLHRYSWTKIVRHSPVPGRHSPDDPALAQYWTDRRHRSRPPQANETWQRALRCQQGLCPLCKETLLYTDQPPDSLTAWETWFKGIRKALAHKAIATAETGRTTPRLVHAHCARRHPGSSTHNTDQRYEDD